MKNTLSVTIRKRNGGFEGLASIPGLKQTRLVRASDGESVYSTTGAVEQAARACASRLGLEVSFDGNNTQSKSKPKPKPKATTQTADSGSLMS